MQQNYGSSDNSTSCTFRVLINCHAGFSIEGVEFDDMVCMVGGRSLGVEDHAHFVEVFNRLV